jgi:ribose transport system permease protein/L-arabinose transport system permease protein
MVSRRPEVSGAASRARCWFALCGLLNGAIITYGRLNAVITTLGTLYVFRGIAYIVTDAKPIGVQDPRFNAIGSGRIFEIPIPLLMLAVVSVVFMIFLRYTDIGRNIYAMGGNPVAARLSGINLNRYRLGIYVLSGVIAGVAAIILTARTNSGQPASGSIGLEFQAITAAVLGGTALSGGKGTIVGTLLGVIVIGTLNNGMILMGIETFYQELARGVLLIAATLIQVWQSRETTR